MKILHVRHNEDGTKQIVEVEVPDLTPEQLASRKAKREERMKARNCNPE